MTLKELLDKCDRKFILKHLKKIHKRDWNTSMKNAYIDVIKTLDKIAKEGGATPDFVISVHYIKEDKVWYVSGIEPEKKHRVGLDFCPWSEWVNAHVFLSPRSPLISVEEIAANVLWEMTFHGFTEEEIENKKNMITSAWKKAVENNHF